MKSTAQIIEECRVAAKSGELSYGHLCELVATAYDEAAPFFDGDSHERFTNEDGKEASSVLRNLSKVWRRRCK